MTKTDLYDFFQDLVKNYDNLVITQSLVYHLFDEGQIEIVKRTHCLTETTSFNLAASTREYDLPTDILHLKQVEFYNGTNYFKLEGASQQELQENTDYPNETATAIPTHYYVKQGVTPVMGFFPTPNAAFTNGCRIFYVKRPNDLTSSANTTPEIPEPYHRLIAQYALWAGHRKDVKNETGDRWYSDFEKGVARMNYDLNGWDAKKRPRFLPYTTDHQQRSVLNYVNRKRI